MRILLVHHDMWLRQLYAEALQSFGVLVQQVSSAQQCVTALDSDDQMDVVIVSLDLPKHNGIEILHEMQSYQDWQRIPIIALSTRQQSEYHVAPKVWRAHGVRDFVYMPDIKPDQLIRRVRMFAK